MSQGAPLVTDQMRAEGIREALKSLRCLIVAARNTGLKVTIDDADEYLNDYKTCDYDPTELVSVRREF